MPGTLENPVLLDPFQAITEVGWPARYLAVRTFINRTFTGAVELCSEPDGPPPEGWGSVYLVSTSFVYPGDTVTGAALGGKSGWDMLSTEAVEVSGMPALPAGGQSYGAWEQRASGVSPASEDVEPNSRWVPPSDADLDIPTPDGVADFFSDTTSASLQLYAIAFTGAPACHATGSSVQMFAPAADDVAPLGDPFPVSFAGVTASHDGRQYAAKAIKARNTTGVTTRSGTVWILCERT